MRADIHIHTTASDGTWGPAELVSKVQTAGIEVFAVSDHDHTGNVAETGRIAKNAGLVFLPAVELNSTKDGHNYHILGYGIDTANAVLQELCSHNRELLEQKDNDSIHMLVKRGWPVSMEEFKEYRYDRRRGGWRALAYLQDKGLCGDVADFFTRIFTAENNLGFPEFPSVGEVVRVVHQAGGLALCAHIASDFHGAGLQECLPRLLDEELDGFECYHSGHKTSDSYLLAHYCQRHGLCISGGSDCHGSFVAARHLGEPLIDTSMLSLPGLLSCH